MLLAYSYSEFRPNEAFSADTGAGRIASAMYEVLRKEFPDANLWYTSTNDVNVYSGPPIDLFVSIEHNFTRNRLYLRPKVSVLVSVNTPSAYRLDWLRMAIRGNAARIFTLDHSDNTFIWPEPRRRVDLTLQLGTKSSCAQARTVSRLALPFRLPFESEDNFDQKSGFEDGILWFPGSVNLRKGAYLVDAIMKEFAGDPITKFYIRGRAHTKPNSALLSKWAGSTAGPKILIQQSYLDFSSKEWAELRSKVKFAISPSFEEGQQDSILRLASEGIPVLMSANCGYDGGPEALVVRKPIAQEWSIAIKRILKMSKDELQDLATEQKIALHFSQSLQQQFTFAIGELRRLGHKTRSPLVLLPWLNPYRAWLLLWTQFVRLLRRLGL